MRSGVITVLCDTLFGRKNSFIKAKRYNSCVLLFIILDLTRAYSMCGEELICTYNPKQNEPCANCTLLCFDYCLCEVRNFTPAPGAPLSQAFGLILVLLDQDYPSSLRARNYNINFGIFSSERKSIFIHYLNNNQIKQIIVFCIFKF